ncbi:MAG: tol-pal system protein YbgF [Phyllobacterium sp.]
MSKTLRKIALGMMVLPFLAVTSVQAANGDDPAPVPELSVIGDPGLPGVFPRADVPGGAYGQSAPVQMAQAADPRVSQLEEQVRQLTGKLEELNFQILQMQEQMRKVQEDNEFRFQELEKSKRSDASDKQDRTVAEAPTDHSVEEASQDASSNSAAPGQAQDSEASTANADSMAIEPQTSDPNAPKPGTQPQTLGTIRFDANGNVIGETQNVPGQQGALPLSPDGQTVVASIPQTDDPKELYQQAYQFLLAGDYRTSEAAFRSHIDRFPNDPASPDARFWLGESLFGQERYREAASVFLDTHRDFPNSRKSAENLLKLGVTLGKMQDKDVACATLASIPQRYPSASTATLERVKHERASIKC